MCARAKQPGYSCIPAIAPHAPAPLMPPTVLCCVAAHQYGVFAVEFQPTTSKAWLITALAGFGRPAGSGQLLAGQIPPVWNSNKLSSGT